jgi:hypothetical protein
MNADPDHGPIGNPEAALIAENRRLREVLEMCRDALAPMQHEFMTSSGTTIACAVTCAYEAACDALAKP